MASSSISPSSTISSSLSGPSANWEVPVWQHPPPIILPQGPPPPIAAARRDLRTMTSTTAVNPSTQFRPMTLLEEAPAAKRDRWDEGAEAKLEIQARIATSKRTISYNG